MKTILQLNNQIICIFLLISFFSFAQKKSNLYNEINHHKEAGDFIENSATILTTKYKTGIYEKSIGKEVTIEKNTIQNIMNKNSKFITVELPILEGKQSVLYLKKRNLLEDDFKIVIQHQNFKQDNIENSAYSVYSGLVDGEETNSLVSIVLHNDTAFGTILIGNKIFSLSQTGKNNNSYRLYENSQDINQAQFTCGVSDDNKNSGLKNAITDKTEIATIPKCVKLHFEITKTLNDQFGGINQSISQFFNLFNIIQTKFADEGITVKVSYLKIWNTDDPYYQSWVGTPGDSGAFQDLGFSSFQSLGGNINGNIGILLGTFSGGIAGLSGGAPCPNKGYNACTIYANSLNQNATCIMHEIGHNLGSHHTHWCGWIGGALDNCYATEGGCPPGPPATNGGTIMSYCGGYDIINNGFGSQPNAVINNTVSNESCITSCNSDASCEDNIVNIGSVTNTNTTSFNVTWTSNYPVKVYFKELSSSSFTLLNTVQPPNNNYTINYVPATDCTFQKFEIKLVSVCPNGDSKPTVIVYSPQAHLKPYVGVQDNQLCNITNPTVLNLKAVGQNLKWYTTETDGTPISSSYILPLNTYMVYFVSQTVNGCESERTRTVVYIQNVETPIGPNSYQFNCESLKASDLYSISSLYTSPNGGYLRWYKDPIGDINAAFANDQFPISTNTTYYVENRMFDNSCGSIRLPVYITTIPSYYSIPFIETFEKPFNCQLGYVSPYYGNNSGIDVNNTLTLNNYSQTNISNYVATKKINLTANVPVKIFFKVKLLNSNSSVSPLQIVINSDKTISEDLGQFWPSGTDTYSFYSFNYNPKVTSNYRIYFRYASPIKNIGCIIDDFGITTQNLDLSNFNYNNCNIYPNPTNNIINISTPNENINQINVYDMLGSLLKSQKGNSDKEQVSIQELPNAIYLLEVKTDKGNKTVKIVKE